MFNVMRQYADVISIKTIKEMAVACFKDASQLVCKD
jgi:hypothetical protein